MTSNIHWGALLIMKILVSFRNIIYCQFSLGIKKSLKIYILGFIFSYNIKCTCRWYHHKFWYSFQYFIENYIEYSLEYNKYMNALEHWEEVSYDKKFVEVAKAYFYLVFQVWSWSPDTIWRFCQWQCMASSSEIQKQNSVFQWWHSR